MLFAEEQKPQKKEKRYENFENIEKSWLNSCAKRRVNYSVVDECAGLRIPCVLNTCWKRHPTPRDRRRISVFGSGALTSEVSSEGKHTVTGIFLSVLNVCIAVSKAAFKLKQCVLQTKANLKVEKREIEKTNTDIVVSTWGLLAFGVVGVNANLIQINHGRRRYSDQADLEWRSSCSPHGNQQHGVFLSSVLSLHGQLDFFLSEAPLLTLKWK